MRVLFVHQNFPGQFLHLLRHLVRQGGHEVVFVTQMNPNHIPGVTKVTYDTPIAAEGGHFDAQDFAAALRRAAAVAAVAAGLRRAGFTPDVVIGHEGWGEMLNVADVWPRAPRLGYREYFYAEAGADVGFDPEFPVAPGLRPRIRAKNAAALLALQQGYPGVTPTRWQRGLYPRWAQPAMTVVPEGVDLGLCRPDPGARARPFALGEARVRPGERLVTFVARELEPYRGFHTLMRALPALLRARRDVRVICLGGDGVAYGLPPVAGGTWRAALLDEARGAIDPARVHFPGKVSYSDHLRLLQRSDVHLYLSYPFIPSWSLREALACGCAVVAADTPAVAEFARAGQVALTPALDAGALVHWVLGLLDDGAERARLGAAARGFAEEALGLERHIAGYEALMQWLSGR